MYHVKLGKTCVYRDVPDGPEGESREHLAIVGQKHAANPPAVMSPTFDLMLFEVGRNPRWIGGATEGEGPGTFTLLEKAKE